MYSYTKVASLCGVLVLSSTLCTTEQYQHSAQWYKGESELMLSLLHLDARRSKLSIHNAACYRVCQCIKKDEIEAISEHDIRDMVSWMMHILQDRSIAKGPSRQDEEQQFYDAITTFLFDCITCSAYSKGITKQSYGPCFSQLVVDSLEACDMHVLGDMVVDGQILNSCCQGSEIGGPAGPTGPTGPMGPIGPRGTCSVSDYLFAAYFSTGFVGTDGNFILDSSSYLEIPSDQEAVIPLGINPSMTSGWNNSAGSSSSFVVPETGLYEISYQISFVQAITGYYPSSQLVTAWIEQGDGTESSQLIASSVAYLSMFYGVSNLAPLSHTFLVFLNANEEITLVCANKGFASGTGPIGTQSVIVVSGASSSIASSLVITRVV